MKKMRLVMTIALVLLTLLVFAGCGAEAADDPNLGLYTADTAEMWGIEMPISDLFENGVSIELKAKGKCTMNFDGTSGNGKWTLEEGAFHAEAGGAVISGTLENGVLLAENVMDMGVNITFAKEAN